MRIKPSAAILVLALSVARLAQACNVPVFRYALERWPADVFEAVVFHRGSLNDDDQAAVRQLDAASVANEGDSNFVVKVVDLDGKVEEEYQKLWEAQGTAKLPRVVLRYPYRAGIPLAAWAGPLAASTPEALINSPMRKRIAHRLLKGDVAVWVLLECGNAKKNDAAEKKLKGHLDKLKTELELPALSEDDMKYLAQPDTAQDMGIKFSIMRLRRDDPQEQALVSILLNSEKDLREYEEPIAFAVFGRARVLFALVGQGIAEENIVDACAFLVGPCSCQAKALNPGTTDLLMNVNWDGVLMGMEEALPPPVPDSMGLPVQQRPAPQATLATQTSAPVVEEPLVSEPLWWNTVLVVAAGFGIVLVAATVMLLRRRT